MEDLTDIFGNEISVSIQPRAADKQFVGFPGGAGVVGMNLGTRGRQLIITGRLRASDNSYANAREKLQEGSGSFLGIDGIEEYQNAEAASYTYLGETYENIIFERFQLVGGAGGKLIFWDGSQCWCDFIMYARQLI